MSVFLLLSPRSLSFSFFLKKKKKEIDTWSSGHFYLSFPVSFYFVFFFYFFKQFLFLSLSLFFVLLFSLLLGNPLLRVCVHLRVSLFLALCCVEGSQRSLRLLDGRTDMALIVYSFRVRFNFFIFFIFSLFVSSS